MPSGREAASAAGAKEMARVAVACVIGEWVALRMSATLVAEGGGVIGEGVQEQHEF